jgi:competence protein ComEA
MVSIARNSRAVARMASLLLFVALAVSPALAVERSALEGVVNINTASAEQLQMLPGVGEVRARAILSERKGRGGFTSVDDLREVKGLGDSLLERMRPYITLKGKTTAQRT